MDEEDDQYEYLQDINKMVLLPKVTLLELMCLYQYDVPEYIQTGFYTPENQILNKLFLKFCPQSNHAQH